VFLLDTNICIDFIDGRSAIAERRVRENFIKGLNVSIITVGELLVGPKTSDDPEGDRVKVERFLSIITVHDFDRKAADIYADIVRTISVKRASFDRLIAAHALSLGLTLVTNNQKHFADVPGLRLANWTV
jgi:tRNA(fMet)-specific endonuclease VapC